MENCRVVEFRGVTNENNSPLFIGFEVEFDAGAFEFRTGIPNGSIVTWDTDDQITLGSLVVTSPFTQIYEGVNGDRWRGTLTKKTKFTFSGCLYTNRILANYIASNGAMQVPGVYIKSMIDYGVLQDFYFEKKLITGGLNINLIELERLELKRFYNHAASDIIINGDISTLKNQVSITSIGLAETNVYGAIDVLISSMCNFVSSDTPNGRISGVLNIMLRDTGCTFLGSKDVQIVNVEFSSSGATVMDVNNTPIKIYTKSNNQWSNP